MKKFITFVLTAAMAVSALGVTVFADDTAPAETPVATKAAEGDKADENAAPAEGDKADENAAPAEGDKAEEPAAPAEGDKTETPVAPAEPTAPAEGDKADENAAPAETVAPVEPAAPAEPAPAAKAAAAPSNAKVMVNGKEVAFAAYNIGGNNYFKLRDVAAALSGTAANFEITYDKATRTTTLLKATAYTGGAEIDATVAAGTKTATLSNQNVMLDGAAAALTAYNIDGFNYFKLRDLGDALGFEVAWDKEARTIAVTAEAAAPAEPEAPADNAAADDKTEAPADNATADDKTEAPSDDSKAPAEGEAK